MVDWSTRPITELVAECPHCGEEHALDLAVRGDVLHHGLWSLDVVRGRITRAGVAMLPPCPSKGAPVALLAALWSAGGRIVSRDRLYDALYGLRAEGEQPDPPIIGVYVCKLRKWLSPIGFRIDCCYGRGLALVWPDEEISRRAA